MTLIEKIKILTGESDEILLGLLIDKVKIELETLIGKTYNEKWENLIEDMVVVRYNKRHNEGISSISINGMSESYQDAYPDYILRQISRLRGNVRFY